MAAAKGKAAAAAPAAQPPAGDGGAGAGCAAKVRLVVTARQARRFRAGIGFSPEPFVVEVSAEDAARLEADPLLIVERQ